MEAAQARAEQIIAQARAEAENIRMDADDYIIETLGSLEAELTRLLNQARNGIATLTAERRTSREQFNEDVEDEETESPEAENWTVNESYNKTTCSLEQVVWVKLLNFKGPCPSPGLLIFLSWPDAL